MEDEWNGRQWSKISCGQGSVEEDEEAAEEGLTSGDGEHGDGE